MAFFSRSPHPLFPTRQTVGAPAAKPPKQGWLGRVALVLLAPVAWLLLLEVSTQPLGPYLDASFVAVMTKYLAEHYRFGADAIYNYGPLSPLWLWVYDGRLYGWVFAGDLVLKGAVVFLVGRLTWNIPGWRRWLLPLAILGALDWQVLLFFATAGAGWLLAARTRADRWLALPALVLLAVLALIKGTLLVLAGAAVVLGAVGCGLRWGFRPALARVVGFAVVLGTLWKVLGQRWGDFPNFVMWTLNLSDGYSRGMSVTPEPPGILALGLALLALLLVQTVCLAVGAGRRDRVAWPLGLLLVATTFLAWKQGYTRADFHVVLFFDYALVAAAMMPLFFQPAPGGRRVAWAHGLTVGAALALSAAGTLRAGGSLTHSWKILRIHWDSNLAILREPRVHAMHLKQSILADRERNTLPQIQRVVGRETVDVFGYEQGVAIANQLNYTPPPVCQGYQANTPLLQGLNQDFYRGPHAPEFVMFKVQPIDDHLPTVEDAGVLATILLDYAPVLFEGDYLLLRRSTPRPTDPGAHPLPLGRTLAEGEIGLGDPLPVPAVAPGEAVWCELDLRESLAGRLLATVYHQFPVYVDLTLAGGQPTVRRRLVPLAARSGFLLSPFLDSERALVAIQAGEPGAPPLVQTLRLVHDDPAVMGQFQPRWHYRLRALPAPVPEVRTAAEDFLNKRGFNNPGEMMARYADVATPLPTHVRSDSAATERFVLDGTTFVLVHAPGEMEWEVPPGRVHVRGRFTMRPNAWKDGGGTDGAEFRVEFRPAGSPAPVVLLDRLLTPREVPGDRVVQDFDLPLSPEAQATGGRLILRSLPGPRGDASYDFTSWGAVRIE